MHSPLHCRTCGSKVDDFTPVGDDDAVPEAGNVSVCLYCGTLSIYTGEGLNLRMPTPEEMAEMAEDEDLQRTVKQVMAASGVLQELRLGGIE